MNNVNPFPSPFETDFEPDDVSDNAAPTVRSAGSTYPFFVDVQKRVCLRKCVSSRKFLISLVIFLFFFASISFVLLVIVTIKRSRQTEDAAFLNQHISWRDKCERKCAGSFDVPPLLLISLDGFRADYLDRELTPAVSRILNCGSQSEYLMPSYPSKTFPNHFTIVTGLYPESHGIVDNYFMDLTMEEQYFSRKSKDGDWYRGEPIWNTVAKNGKKSATFFWPGSEVPIKGIQPTYRYTFNSSLPFSKRVDQVIEWLELSEVDRPSFLAMYFEQPDAAGHREGPESDLVNSALIYVDAMINYLMYRLDKKGYLGCINIVLLSDHGSQKLREDHFIAVENYLDINDTNLEIFTGAIGQLTFKNKSDVNMAAKIAPFACQEGHTFRVYTKDIMPKRYHYGSNNRIGDIVLDASAGTRIFKTNEELRACDDKGDHGYDNRIKEMRAIFGAYGPSLKENFHIPPFQNIELYNLFTDLMQFPYTADNNGTRGVLYPILKKAPDYEPTQTVELNACEDLDMIKCGDGCHFELNYGENVKQKQSSCIAQSVQVPQDMDHSSKPCLVKLCNSSLVYSKRFAMAMMVESILADPVPNIDHRANCTAHLKFEKTKIEETTTSTASTTSTTTSMPTSSETSTTEPSKNIDEKDVQPSNQETPLPADFFLTNRSIEAAISLPSLPTPFLNLNQSGSQQPVTTGSTPVSECAKSSPMNMPNSSWISLFSNNDYSRYISQGQIRVPNGFYHGPWKQIVELIRKYRVHYKQLVMFTGPVYDYDNDGLADDLAKMYGFKENSSQDNPLINLPSPPPPTHIFVMLMRCRGPSKWHSSLRSCDNTERTATLSFVLPLVEKDINCLFPIEYLFRHTTRVRDIELLTNLEWFTDSKRYSPETALRLRTHINDQLWQMETGKSHTT